jgi:hypothetical protein
LLEHSQSVIRDYSLAPKSFLLRSQSMGALSQRNEPHGPYNWVVLNTGNLKLRKEGKEEKPVACGQVSIASTGHVSLMDCPPPQ